jgi:putative PIN family toxin of toxin-antitoxin system
VRAVLDPNVLVSAVISPAGPPGSILLAWSLGQFELVISAKLLDELAEVLARPKLERWVSQATAREYVDALAESATMIDDPPDPPKRSVDPDDDYLLALIDAANANYLVSGDPHLTGLATHDVPVETPNAFLAKLLAEDLPDESPST